MIFSLLFSRRSVQNTEHFTLGAHKVKVPGGAPCEAVVPPTYYMNFSLVVNMRTNREGEDNGVIPSPVWISKCKLIY